MQHFLNRMPILLQVMVVATCSSSTNWLAHKDTTGWTSASLSEMVPSSISATTSGGISEALAYHELTTINEQNKGHEYAYVELLPTEILDQIIAMIRMTSATCLAISSHTLYYRLRNDNWWAHPNTEKQQRLSLLNLLHKDVPYLFLCEDCVRFHRPEPLLSLNPFPRKCSRECERINGCVRTGQHLTLPFHQAQMVANHCLIYRGRLHTFTPLHKTHRSGKHGRVEEYMTTSATTASGHLIIWTQTRLIMLSRNRSSTVPAKYLPYICPHVGDLDGKQDMLLKLKESSRADKYHCEVQWSCPRCPTDGSMKVGSLVTGTEYLVNTWRDLGSCTASTNPEWSSQRVPQHVQGASDMQAWGNRPFPYRAASVRANIEASTHDRPETGGREVAEFFEENQRGDMGLPRILWP